MDTRSLPFSATARDDEDDDWPEWAQPERTEPSAPLGVLWLVVVLFTFGPAIGYLLLRA